MFPGFDPSKLDPRLIREISELMRELPPAQLMKMQTIMHNSMAGFDVSKEAAEFEAALPPGFREKMAKIMYQASGAIPVETAAAAPTEPAKPVESPREARLVVLKAVAAGTLTPEQALDALFPNEN